MFDTINVLKNLDIDEANAYDAVKHIIIYLRKSRKDEEFSKDEAIEKTLQRHEEQLQRFSISTFGVKIPENNIYREVVSGDTIEYRPTFKSVLSKIENPDIKAVLIVEVERLGRGDGEDQAKIIKTFKFTDTKIITPYKIYDLSNEYDLQLLEDNLYQSRKYYKYTKKVLRNGISNSVLEGKWPYSTNPYGLVRKKLEFEKGYTLIDNEQEKTILNFAADLFINGIFFEYEIKYGDTYNSVARKFGINYKYVKELFINSNKNENKILIEIPDAKFDIIANYFNYLKIESRSGRKWTANMLRNILTSSTSYGYITFGRRSTKITMINGKTIKARPISSSDKYATIKGRFEAPLDKKYHNAIRKKIEANARKPYKNEELKNPLAGLIICGKCGKYMTRRAPTIGKDIKYKKQRVHNFTEKEIKDLSSLIHEKYINSKFSIKEISKLVNYPKTKMAKILSSNPKYFRLPPADKWNEIKKILDISNCYYDNFITEYSEIKYSIPSYLYCKDKDCSTIAADLELVEGRVIETLKKVYNDYKKYIEINQLLQNNDDNNNNTDMNAVINKEIKTIQKKLEKIYEFVEDGTYDKKTFTERYITLNNRLRELHDTSKQFSKKKEIDKKDIIKLSLPKIELILDKYNTSLNATQKNLLLSSFIKQIKYYKEIGGRNNKDSFLLEISLKLKP